jgi:hypothetical protein
MQRSGTIETWHNANGFLGGFGDFLARKRTDPHYHTNIVGIFDSVVLDTLVCSSFFLAAAAALLR